MKKITVMVIMLIALVTYADDLTVDLAHDPSDKSISIDSYREAPVEKTLVLELNSKETFKKVKKNDVVVLLVGNNDYEAESQWPALFQCVNDTTLLSRILTICCKVPADNIHISNNITADTFRHTITSIIKTLHTDQSFLIYYSGHGDRDGSLVFTDGELITPSELKDIINSFASDTVLMLDACYSGKNDGVIELNNDNQKFKPNSIRIYSSLAHMKSKEIVYTNEFFSYINPFYETVLNLKGPDKMMGNGYFTSFIGYFFADYDFDTTLNINYWDLISYISNKTKHYVEFLAIRGDTTDSNSEEINTRLDQHPKIIPMVNQQKYLDQNHSNILIKKYIRPAGLVLEVMTGPFLSFGIYPGIINDNNINDNEPDNVFVNKVAGYAAIRFLYNPHFLKNFLFGIECDYLLTYKTDVRFTQDTYLHMIPIIGIVGYRRQFVKLKNRLSVRADIGAGISFNIANLKEYKEGDNVKEESVETAPSFCFQAGTGISFHPVKNLAISLDVYLHGVVMTEENVLLGIKFPLSVSYKL